MADPRLEDHAVGVELQLTELTEELERARVQGRTERMGELEDELARLRDDLAASAMRSAEHFAEPEIDADHAG